MRSRIILVHVLVTCMFLVLVGRLWQVQVVDGERYARAATADHERHVVVPAVRGRIVDSRGRPLVRNRTATEIQEARAVPISELKDPEADQARVRKDNWLVVVGVCTHLGCVPLGQKPTDAKGEYGGWFCPCHGSHYDTSARIRKGPAPSNLLVPDYAFTSDTNIRIG